MKIAGRIVLVTGATGGLGQAVARDLAVRGARLLVTGRNVELLEQLAGELGGTALPSDLANRRDVAALATASREADIVVSNAALPATGPLADFTEDEIGRALDVNLRAGIILARALSPAMVERGRGHFVFVSSMGAKMASAGLALYSATKFGLRGFRVGPAPGSRAVRRRRLIGLSRHRPRRGHVGGHGPPLTERHAHEVHPGRESPLVRVIERQHR